MAFLSANLITDDCDQTLVTSICQTRQYPTTTTTTTTTTPATTITTTTPATTITTTTPATTITTMVPRTTTTDSTSAAAVFTSEATEKKLSILLKTVLLGANNFVLYPSGIFSKA